MKKSMGAALVTAATIGLVGFGAAPAFAATCNSGNMCSYNYSNYGGTTWQGGHGSFVEVPDDVANSARNFTSNNYNAMNNTAWAQEEVLGYIAAGHSISSFSGYNNMIDHYREA